MTTADNTNSTTRFADRVDNYVKYRPGYPVAIVNFLQEKYAIDKSKKIVDIGAGTGISSEIFLKEGYAVTAVEPNREMREKSVELLKQYSLFNAVNGTAENPNLEDQSADVIVCGQAFHWFDREKAKASFRKLLKPGGLLVLIWNERLTSDDFLKAYDQLIIKHSTDYVRVDHRNISDEDMTNYFAPEHCEITTFANYQHFDFDGLEGRLLSSSYMPNENAPGYEDMIADLHLVFDQYAKSGKVSIGYATKVYSGQI